MDAFTDAAGGFRVGTVAVDFDPVEAAGATGTRPGFSAYFGRSDGEEIGALGSAWEATSPPGEGRLVGLAADLPRLPGVRYLVGYSFEQDGGSSDEWEGFGPARAVLPRLAVERGPSGGRLVAVLAPGEDEADFVEWVRSLEAPSGATVRQAADRTIESVPAPDVWMDAVGEAIAGIEAGAFEKVVLARSVLVRSDIAPDPFELVARLRRGYPDCYTYAWRWGDTSFVGASPELLANIAGGELRSEPLAGTTGRGHTEDWDRFLGEQLMASSKNRLEHQVVIHDIATRLSPMTDYLHVPSSPTLRRMSNVQHLSTQISGRVRPGIGVLDVAAALHPTPAVGGSPTDEAVGMIRKLEHADRGWYSGGIGWTTADGEGEIAIALRCALVRGSTSHLYAGAGIVAGSNPQAELEETRLKFGPMLSLLTEA